ncbi:MAG: hypothetical protein EAX86_01840 [Candidatus Heimdallarchaeota archaeon]|nr:hypothetical protein [Candidatus Heimdallarchaeota archaeon]
MKIYCDSHCRPCILDGGPSRNIDDISFSAFFCPACRSAFFCEVGVVQQFSRQNRIHYSCFECGTTLETKTLEEIGLEKARFLMDSKKLSSSGKFRSTLIPKKPLRTMKNLSMLFETKTISAFHRSLITEILGITGLTPQVISNFARDFGISENVISSLAGDTESTLLTLSSISPNFIEILHSILIGRDPTIQGGLALRFSVFSSNISEIVFIQPSRSLIESGPYDLLAYDNQGMRIWVFCVSGIIDASDIETIIGPILDLFQDPNQFKGVSQIYIVGQGFSWVAKQILRKYRGIVVTESNQKTRSIPFVLWQEKILGEDLNITFENIKF